MRVIEFTFILQYTFNHERAFRATLFLLPLENATMEDLTIALENRPGALAELGDALAQAGVSIEGGGAWVVNGQAVATKALPHATK